MIMATGRLVEIMIFGMRQEQLLIGTGLVTTSQIVTVIHVKRLWALIRR